jgi:hypothetical protein
MRGGEAGHSSEPSIVILVGVSVGICFGFLLSVLRCSILGCSGRTGSFGALAGRFLGESDAGRGDEIPLSENSIQNGSFCLRLRNVGSLRRKGGGCLEEGRKRERGKEVGRDFGDVEG